MPVIVVCPACKARLKAPDNLIGKTVKCPRCSKAVLVKAAAAAVPAPVYAPPQKPAVKPAPGVEEDPTEDREPAKDEEPTEDMGPMEDQIPAEEEEVEARPKKRKRGSGTLLNLFLLPFRVLVRAFTFRAKR
jgi:DNA-directed RNA polymerase subunit RPC12/RpoP